MDPFNYILDESNTDIHVLRGGGFCTPLADSKFKYELLLSHEQGKKKAVSPCGIPEDEVCEKRLKQKPLDSEFFLFHQILGHHVTIIYESDRHLFQWAIIAMIIDRMQLL